MLPGDYEKYVDGKPRRDGVRSFLESREIELPLGSAADRPEADTIYGLGLRKNDLVLKLIHDEGSSPTPDAVSRSDEEAAKERGLRRAVVSSSANCRDVLIAAGIEDLFEARIDGIVAERDQLAGKPAPDTFLAGAKAVKAPSPPRPRYSRMRKPASRPDAPGSSVGSSGSTAPDTPMPSALTGPMWWSRSFPSC